MSVLSKRLVLIGCVVLASGLIAVGVSGCRDTMPHSFTLAGGDVSRTHGKPMEGGYYTDWDPFAKGVEIIPLKDVNPVNTQHILVVTVKDENGEPLPNRRVEWIIPDGSVGTIVEVDASGWRASRGHKVTNKFAITHTNNGPHTLTRGNDDPSDDIHLEKGQSWCVITSPVEGTTHVIAYVPGIYNWDKHKVFAKKHWYDVAWTFPPSATNPVNTPHKLTTLVTTHSDKKPLKDYHVIYTILDGPGATFANGQKKIAVKTDARGYASATMNQTSPVEGTNRIQIDVVRPENKKCCKPAVHLARGCTTKTWLGPKIAIRKSAPATAMKGQQFLYDIVVSNPAQVDATNVVVTDVLPNGIAYVSSNPTAQRRGQTLTWNLGALGGGKDRRLQVTVRGTRTGTFENCADVHADLGLKGRSCAQTKITEPRIVLTKEGPKSIPTICSPITYTFTVTNKGDAPATNVVLHDTLPNGLTWKDTHRSIKAEMGTLQPGESKQASFSVKAKRLGTYVNRATVTGDGGLRDSAQLTTKVHQPVLVISKVAPRTRFLGRKMTYKLTVTNKGDGPSTDTVLTDTLPAHVEFVSATGRGVLRDGKVTWSLGTLQPGKSVTVNMTVKAVTVGTAKNVAKAEGFCVKAQAAATTVIKGIPAILLECVDVEDPIEVGAPETYVITVTNQGTAAATNIRIVCTVPGELAFTGASGPTAHSRRGNVVTFKPVKSLAPRGKVVFRINAKGAKAGDARFSIEMISDQITTSVKETESTTVYEDE